MLEVRKVADTRPVDRAHCLVGQESLLQLRQAQFHERALDRVGRLGVRGLGGDHVHAHLLCWRPASRAFRSFPEKENGSAARVRWRSPGGTEPLEEGERTRLLCS